MNIPPPFDINAWLAANPDAEDRRMCRTSGPEVSIESFVNAARREPGANPTRDEAVSQSPTSCPSTLVPLSEESKKNRRLMGWDLARKLKLGDPVADWLYHDNTGNVIFTIIRYDRILTDGYIEKTYRPIKRVGDAWAPGDPKTDSGLLPLYLLPTVSRASRIFVVEGEKAALALAKIGFPVTTPSHGAMSSYRTDWNP